MPKMSNVMHNVNNAFQKITFGMGCFWANDALFGAMPGVLRTRVGYSGGTLLSPTYRNMGDHTEVVEVDYDPAKVTFNSLLDQFWQHHEYGITTKIKKQYASRIFYHTDEQKKFAEEALKVESAKHGGKLQTEIHPAGVFYPAEDYHQKYRLQRYPWICEALKLTPELLQTSHVAARLNGFIAGIGESDEVLKMEENWGVPKKVAEFVQKQYNGNKGGNLYC